MVNLKAKKEVLYIYIESHDNITWYHVKVT